MSSAEKLRLRVDLLKEGDESSLITSDPLINPSDLFVALAAMALRGHKMILYDAEAIV